MPATLLIAGCDGGGTGTPDEPTIGETRALDDAAEMLEQQRLADDAAPSIGEVGRNPGTEPAP